VATWSLRERAVCADQCRQPLFDVEVHVLEIDRPDERSARDLGANGRHPALDRREIVGAEHADSGQHARMRERPGDVPLGQTIVEADRRGEALDQFGNGFVEPAGPAAGRGRKGFWHC